ncbi:ABC transporter ATP-binding protein [Kribbella amoyensis]|nr:ATP-binding cassette domain-containing protein [Kribbella amoyensis]
MLTIDALVKRRGARVVLSEVSFQATPGRITAFLGPNGAGKSSTLRILLGLDRATSGTALVGGRPYHELRHPLRAVGSVLDGSGAHRSRRAAHHLAWIARSNGIAQRRVDEVLDQVGLADSRKTKAGRLSLGMGCRLSLAAALLGEPEALVLDEPSNGLDPDGIRWLRDLLRDHAAAGGTVLLSSHQIGEVAQLADDLVVLAGGRVVASGPCAEIGAGHQTLEDAFFVLTQPGEQR